MLFHFPIVSIPILVYEEDSVSLFTRFESMKWIMLHFSLVSDRFRYLEKYYFIFQEFQFQFCSMTKFMFQSTFWYLKQIFVSIIKKFEILKNQSKKIKFLNGVRDTNDHLSQLLKSCAGSITLIYFKNLFFPLCISTDSFNALLSTFKHSCSVSFMQ